MFSKDRFPIILLLFSAGVINYLDRSALSIAAPFIQQDLTLSATQMGLIFSSFSVGYAVFNFLGGVASDRYGAKLTLCTAMIVWSLFSGAVALAFGFVSLLIIRVLFGMGEAAVGCHKQNGQQLVSSVSARHGHRPDKQRHAARRGDFLLDCRDDCCGVQLESFLCPDHDHRFSLGGHLV